MAPVFEFLLNKVANTCNFIIKRLHHRRFLAKLAKFLRKPISKNICHDCFCRFFLMALCSLFVIDLSTTNKMQRQGLIFLQKSKIKTLGSRKKIFFSVNSFQKILTFHICVSSENTQCFVGAVL